MRVITGDHALIKSWAVDPEKGAIDQAIAVAQLPFVLGHVALMPDAHQGYGMPIGGVLFAEKAVVPYAVGVDIGCGVALIETNITTDALDEKTLRLVLDQIARDVPYGRRGHDAPIVDPYYDDTFHNVSLPFPIQKIFDDATHQLGSLGGGNHFIEVERDEEGHVYVMLHSGSRSYGKRTCDYYHNLARDLNERWHSVSPNTFLAYLPTDDESGKEYMDAMNIGLLWAELNRRLMADIIVRSFQDHVPGFEGSLTIDVHHNYAAWENHKVKHKNVNGIVHRKGAVRARKGETVLIPGSMGVGSYIATGLGNKESFETCQHGAGRAMSRTAATNQWNKTTLAKEMKEIGVLMAGDAAVAVDEAPGAYKDLLGVMAASADLIEPVRRLFPMGVVKGD